MTKLLIFSIPQIGKKMLAALASILLGAAVSAAGVDPLETDAYIPCDVDAENFECDIHRHGVNHTRAECMELPVVTANLSTETVAVCACRAVSSPKASDAKGERACVVCVCACCVRVRACVWGGVHVRVALPVRANGKDGTRDSQLRHHTPSLQS